MGCLSYNHLKRFLLLIYSNNKLYFLCQPSSQQEPQPEESSNDQLSRRDQLRKQAEGVLLSYSECDLKVKDGDNFSITL